MGLGSNVQNVVSKVIADLGSTVALLKMDSTKNSYGFASYSVVESGTAKCVPSNFFKKKLGAQPMGRLNEGEVRMLFAHDSDYPSNKGTAEWRAVISVGSYAGTYIPVSEKPIILQDLVMAYPVVFTLEEESGY